LNGKQVDTIKATPGRFGQGVEQAMKGAAEEHFKPYLAIFGSRTFRVLTLFALSYHLMPVIKAIKSLAIDLTREHNVTRIRPVIVASTGGGCGSALMVLISYLFSHPETRWLLSGELGEHVFEPIVVFAVDPFTHNAIVRFAFRSSEGVVVSTVEDISRMVSNALIDNQLLSNELSSRGTDLFEIRKMTEKYTGDDGASLGWPYPLHNPFVGQCLFTDPKVGEI
jgi:hypothetical protein